ncbi:MAG: hypothetical protein LC674_00925, partial [Actinobacteria bacterium]|nr:hypothetical protein [Actinomycetota bacterium]
PSPFLKLSLSSPEPIERRLLTMQPIQTKRVEVRNLLSLFLLGLILFLALCWQRCKTDPGQQY